MFIQVVILLAGLLLILFGANWLVDGSSSIAKKTGLSEFIIGLTIVGIGTSTPEMVVSFISSIQGKSDLAIGNIVGSNIFNTMMILGVTALISPLLITKDNLKRDIPLNIFVTALLILLGMKQSIFGAGSDTLSRADGGIMLLIFAWYMWMSFRNGNADGQEDDGNIKIYSGGISAILVITGLAALIIGGRMFVNSATAIAEDLHLSERFIAITVMAAGTSLPELATCIVAALKGRGQLALGNILGSNISNILLILGGAALINPLSFSGMTPVDLGAVMISAIFILASAYTFKTNRLDRFEGGMLIAMEIAYMIWLFITPA